MKGLGGKGGGGDGMGSSGWRVPPGSSCSFRSVDVRIVSGRKRERDRRTGRKEPPFASRLYQTWKRNPADGSALRDKDGWVQDQQRVCEENFGDRRRKTGGQEIESGGVGGGGVWRLALLSLFGTGEREAISQLGSDRTVYRTGLSC